MTEFTDVGGVIAAALSAAEGMPRLLAGVRVEQRERFDALEHRVNQLEDRLDGVFDEVRGVHAVLREMSAAFQVLSDEHYERHVIEPIASVLSSLLDVTLSVKTEETALVSGIRSQLVDLLARFNITVICPREGEAFVRASMKPGGTVRTSNADEDLTVARVLKVGFRRDTHVLRPATVTLRRFDATVPTHLAGRRTT